VRFGTPRPIDSGLIGLYVRITSYCHRTCKATLQNEEGAGEIDWCNPCFIQLNISSAAADQSLFINAV